MNYLKIKNNGVMDITGLYLLGASSKRNQNKIGMFGSGNKYAMAYLLRNNFELKICAGMQEVEVTTRPIVSRDQDFQLIVVDGKDTSITTEFGKDWELWQAIREVYCNALDEGGAVLEYVSEIKPCENETHFYIKTNTELKNLISQFDSYFAVSRKVLFECDHGKIYAKATDTKLNLFRKQIRCFETELLSVYDYDLPTIQIDENRLVKYSWYVASMIWNVIYSCTDKEVIRTILFQCSDSGYVECLNEDYSVARPELMSQEYIEVLNELKLAPKSMSGLVSIEEMGQTTIIPTQLFQQAKAVVDNSSLAAKFKVYKDCFYVDVEPKELHYETLRKCAAFFKECNYDEVNSYPVKVARFEDKTVHGFADIENSIIYISELAVEKGVQYACETLLEEYIHIKHHVYDETRGFQNAAIGELINILKRNYAFSI